LRVLISEYNSGIVTVVLDINIERLKPSKLSYKALKNFIYIYARAPFGLSPNNVVHVHGLSFFSCIDTHLDVFSSIEGLKCGATHIIFFTINLHIFLEALMQAPYFLVNGQHANTNHFLNNTSASFSTNEYFLPTC